MKKISINTNHLMTFSELSAEKVKKIIIGLLVGDLQSIHDAECRGIARIILNENLMLSEKRRASKKSASNLNNVEEELSTQNELSTQKNNEQSEQTQQSEQNEQIFPLASPILRMTNNKKININSSRAQGCGKNNCFNQHLTECERVPIKTEKQREPFFKAFKDIFEKINQFGYDKKPEDPGYNLANKIAKEDNKNRYLNAMTEIIDTFIEMLEKLETSKFINCGKERLSKEDIAQMALRCNYDVLRKVLYQLAYESKKIVNHPYYILKSIWQNIKEKQ
ncbi:MAG: hypothetical protein ACI4TI_02370 [Christensenellales bacterium]